MAVVATAIVAAIIVDFTTQLVTRLIVLTPYPNPTTSASIGPAGHGVEPA